MNTALLKAKMDDFFAGVSPDYLINQFEKMGYNFIDSDLHWNSMENYMVVGCLRDGEDERNVLQRIFRKRKKINSKKLTSEYSGSFFCLRIA